MPAAHLSFISKSMTLPLGAQRDHLRVLAADVEHRRGVGEQRGGPGRVRLDLGHDLAAERLARAVAAVAGGDERVVRAALDERARRGGRVETRVRHGAVHDAAVFQPHRIHAARSDVESEYSHAVRA